MLFSKSKVHSCCYLPLRNSDDMVDYVLEKARNIICETGAQHGSQASSDACPTQPQLLIEEEKGGQEGR